MTRLAVAAFTAFLLILSNSAFTSAAEITVSAAMSLKSAFEEIGKLYEAQHPGSGVRFNFGASGDLARQIAGGAPIDAFASAAQKDMNDLSAMGLIRTATRVDFAGNELVLAVPARGGKVKSFADLANPSVKRIAVSNPKTSPAGRYATEAFDYYRLADRVRSKLIFGETVRQVMDYIARGEVDAGVVFASDAAVRSRDVTVVATAAPGSHGSILYPIAVTRDTRHAAEAAAFITLVRSSKGQLILKKYGFGAR